MLFKLLGIGNVQLMLLQVAFLAATTALLPFASLSYLHLSL